MVVSRSLGAWSRFAHHCLQTADMLFFGNGRQNTADKEEERENEQLEISDMKNRHRKLERQ
jgi:hypothetical protein